MAPEKWLESIGSDCKNIAEAWDLVPSTVWRMVTGRYAPSFELIAHFQLASGGAVTLTDWLAQRPAYRDQVRKKVKGTKWRKASKPTASTKRKSKAS